MSGFCAVNMTVTVTDPLPKSGEEATPTTPRPGKSFADALEHTSQADDPAAKTPTRDSFAGISGQKPLPDIPFSPGHTRSDSKMEELANSSREASQISTGSGDSSQDVTMKDDEDKDGSDVEDNADEDNGRPSKKKKGQRFFCTDFPPCELSFTRSEHLARHIR
jgi:C2H2 transcription facotor